MEICGNTTESFIHLSPKLHVRVKISGAVFYKSCRNFSLVEGSRKTMSKTPVCWECCVCCLVSVEHLFIFPDWDLTVLMVSQLRAPLLDCFLSDRYSMLFLPPLQPPQHTLSLSRETVCVWDASVWRKNSCQKKSLGFSSFQKNKFVRRENSSVMAIECNILDTV